MGRNEVKVGTEEWTMVEQKDILAIVNNMAKQIKYGAKHEKNYYQELINSQCCCNNLGSKRQKCCFR
jgi:hypothetical protein